MSRKARLREPALVKALLILAAFSYIALMLLLPLGAVLAEALKKGVALWLESVTEPDARSAIWLTLTVAAISVPLNTVFGIAAAWFISKYDFRGKPLLITLIELPFSVSPVVSGLVFVLLFGAQGWFGEWLIERDIEVIFAIPGLVLAVLAVSMFGKGLIAPIVALSIAYIPIVSRLVRASARQELSKPYIAALRIQGVGSFAICFRHLVPALLPAVLAQSTVGFGYAMLDLAAISFLGLGAQPPSSDWGVMIAGGQPSLLVGAPEQSMFPAALVVVTVLAVNILGARVTTWAEGADR